MSETLREIGRKAEALCGEAYFVGGCVRDLLRGVPSKDVDLAVSGGSHRLGRALANELGGHVFFLRQEDEVVRVLLPALEGLQIDVSPLRGTLDEDLRARDLTINAMAVPAAAGLEPGAPVIDPAGGRQDLADRLIRFTSPESPVADPLRTMRAFRFRWKLEFAMAPGTLERVRECVPLLRRVSAERLRDELFQLLALPTAPEALAEMLDAGVGPWLAGADADFALSPGRVAEVIERLHDRAPERLGALLATEPTAGRRRREVLLWGAALQPLELDPGAACRYLALSNDERRIITKGLAAAPQAAELVGRWPVPGRERYRFFKSAGAGGPEAVLLSPGAWSDAHRELLAEALERHDNPPQPLLTGNQIMALLRLKPGKELGRIIEALAEAQADGEVSTPEQAEAWLRAGGAARA